MPLAQQILHLGFDCFGSHQVGIRQSKVLKRPKSETLCRGITKGNSGEEDKVPPYGTPYSGNYYEMESPVPRDQLPINEFNSLRNSRYFSWALGSEWSYGWKIAAIGAGCTLFLGWPVAAVSVDPEIDFLRCGIGALCGGIVAATLAALRLYFGWSHIGNRLFSATIEYEETGWYDGQVWIKPPEVIARDRLIGLYTVQPALNRVKMTLVGLALSLSASVVLLQLLPIRSPEMNQVGIPDTVSNNSYNDSSAMYYEPQAFEDNEMI